MNVSKDCVLVVALFLNSCSMLRWGGGGEALFIIGIAGVGIICVW